MSNKMVIQIKKGSKKCVLYFITYEYNSKFDHLFLTLYTYIYQDLNWLKWVHKIKIE